MRVCLCNWELPPARCSAQRGEQQQQIVSAANARGCATGLQPDVKPCPSNFSIVLQVRVGAGRSLAAFSSLLAESADAETHSIFKQLQATAAGQTPAHNFGECADHPHIACGCRCGRDAPATANRQPARLPSQHSLQQQGQSVPENLHSSTLFTPSALSPFAPHRLSEQHTSNSSSVCSATGSSSAGRSCTGQHRSLPGLVWPICCLMSWGQRYAHSTRG